MRWPKPWMVIEDHSLKPMFQSDNLLFLLSDCMILKSLPLARGSKKGPVFLCCMKLYAQVFKIRKVVVADERKKVYWIHLSLLLLWPVKGEWYIFCVLISLWFAFRCLYKLLSYWTWDSLFCYSWNICQQWNSYKHQSLRQ